MARKKAEPKVEEPVTKFQYHEDFTPAPEGYIFVFGSNLAGFHGAGAAKAALDYYGAKIGWEGGEGMYGRSYAIPTKNQWLVVRDMSEIGISIAKFVTFTKERKDLKFFVTQVGCGLAGLNPLDIAPLFYDAQNCNFPEPWKDILESYEQVE